MQPFDDAMRYQRHWNCARQHKLNREKQDVEIQVTDGQQWRDATHPASSSRFTKQNKTNKNVFHTSTVVGAHPSEKDSNKSHCQQHGAQPQHPCSYLPPYTRNVGRIVTEFSSWGYASPVDVVLKVAKGERPTGLTTVGGKRERKREGRQFIYPPDAVFPTSVTRARMRVCVRNTNTTHVSKKNSEHDGAIGLHCSESFFVNINFVELNIYKKEGGGGAEKRNY